MSEEERRARTKTWSAVTTPKSNTRPLAEVKTRDTLAFEPKPADVAPFSAYPLPEGRAIQIGYRVMTKNGMQGPTGQFAYPTGAGGFRLPISREDHLRKGTTAFWPIPYGHAALLDRNDTAKERAVGRIVYHAATLPKGPVVVHCHLRVMESVVGFIVGEMNRNVDDGVISKCYGLNVAAVKLEQAARYMPQPASGAAYVTAAEMRAAAFALFYSVERTGGIWDHKETIGPVWGQINRLGDSSDTYFYDIWSNIHFGYVGHAAAFSMNSLYIGSGIQNFLDHFRGDENADTGSAKEGFDLYRPGRTVTIEDVLRVVARHPEWRWSERNPTEDGS
jgi:hypothetical protein